MKELCPAGANQKPVSNTFGCQTSQSLIHQIIGGRDWSLMSLWNLNYGQNGAPVCGMNPMGPVCCMYQMGHQCVVHTMYPTIFFATIPVLCFCSIHHLFQHELMGPELN